MGRWLVVVVVVRCWEAGPQFLAGSHLAVACWFDLPLAVVVVVAVVLVRRLVVVPVGRCFVVVVGRY